MDKKEIKKSVAAYAAVLRDVSGAGESLNAVERNEFFSGGGFSERLYKARSEHRQNGQKD